jgi:hypothetical protein
VVAHLDRPLEKASRLVGAARPEMDVRSVHPQERDIERAAALVTMRLSLVFGA